MDPFKYSLPNGGVVSGIQNIPPLSKSTPKFVPLIVALHGGMYECHYFDADSRHTASISSNAYQVPFVSIDRPCYGESSSLLPVPEESDFVRETAIWLHDYILPTLWSKIGVENGCNCIVFLCHSLGTMYGVAAAALHGQDENPLYPLGGVIWSGLADVGQPHMYENCISKPYDPLGEQSISSQVKDEIMFRPETVHEDVLKLTKKLDSPAPLAELESLPASWLSHWKEEWAAHVKVPVMLAMMEHEPFFVVSEERLRGCAVAFSKSPRVDSSFIWGAPHCMELSFWSQGWYARAFGFAIECSVHKGVSSRDKQC